MRFRGSKGTRFCSLKFGPLNLAIRPFYILLVLTQSTSLPRRRLFGRGEHPDLPEGFPRGDRSRRRGEARLKGANHKPSGPVLRQSENTVRVTTPRGHAIPVACGLCLARLADETIRLAFLNPAVWTSSSPPLPSPGTRGLFLFVLLPPLFSSGGPSPPLPSPRDWDWFGPANDLDPT